MSRFTKTRPRGFELAEQDNVERLNVAVGRVLRAMGFEIEKVLVTDESMIADFAISDEDVVRVSETLGVKVSPSDFVWQVAEHWSSDLSCSVRKHKRVHPLC